MERTYGSPLAESNLPTAFGMFHIHAFAEGLVARSGDPLDGCLVRIHSSCLTGEVFHSTRCDCREQLDAAMNLIAKEGGLIVYLQQEGRGIGLVEKIKAYHLQDKGMDTYQANAELGHPEDARTYDAAVSLLRQFNLRRVRLLTNNPEKVAALEAAGIRVQQIPLQAPSRPEREQYLAAKKARGHTLEFSK